MSNPLTLQHQKLGAVLNADQTPVRYQDTEKEYWCVKNSAGLIDLSHIGRITTKGKDRIAFLNGLLTNDITQLKENTGMHSALLTAKARVLADLYLYGREDHVLIDTGESTGTRVKSKLEQFIITEDVQIKDDGSELLQFSIQGPKAAEALDKVLGVNVENLSQLSLSATGPALIIARDRTGVGGYDIILPVNEAEAVWHGFLLKGGDLGVEPVGLEAMNILRLEKGVPKYGVDVDENIIVLEAGFKDAISFGKGCYMGQEVVARATHIGRVNKLLVQLEVPGKTPPELNSKLLREGAEAGLLTSAAYSPGRERIVGLGYVRRELAVEGTALTVDVAGTREPVIVGRTI